MRFQPTCFSLFPPHQGEVDMWEALLLLSNRPPLVTRIHVLQGRRKVTLNIPPVDKQARAAFSNFLWAPLTLVSIAWDLQCLSTWPHVLLSLRRVTQHEIIHAP